MYTSARLRISFLFAVVSVSTGSGLVADTVYLKNGAWIDGIVRSRSGDLILVDIGDVGRMEIRLEDVYEIEKNSRSGHRGVTASSRAAEDARGERVKPGSQPGSEGAGASSRADDGSDSSNERDGVDSEGLAEASDDDEDDEDEEDAFDDISPELRERIEGLVHDLQRQKSKYRVRAQRHLKAVGAPAIPFLLPLCGNDSELVRTAVFRLFSQFGDERVIDVCIEGLADSNEYVRDYANQALSRISGEDFGFKPFAAPGRRESAAAKWARWWRAEKVALEELEIEATPLDDE